MVRRSFMCMSRTKRDNVIKLGFGDPNMEIKRDDPTRRKSFRFQDTIVLTQVLNGNQDTGHVISGELGAKVDN